MKETKTYCDLCGTEVKKGYGVDQGILKLSGRIDKEKTRMGRISWEDICHTCSIELFDLLYKFQETRKSENS